MLTIAVAPPLVLVTLRKTSMNGKLVVVFSASSGLPRQNSVAMNMPNPREPFSATDANMLRGMTTEAFSISSARERDKY